MAIKTLAQLRTASQRRADMENSSFVSTAEWNTYIETGIVHLWDLVVSCDSDHLLTRAEVTVDANADGYQFPPSVVYHPKGVDLVDGSDTLTLLPFNFQERNMYQGSTATALGRIPYRYHWTQDKLRIIPTPTSALSLVLWFVPVPVGLTYDTDSMNFYAGWDEYVVLDAAIRALTKEESDSSILMAERARIEEKIRAAATNRDHGLPETVTDVDSINDWWY